MTVGEIISGIIAGYQVEAKSLLNGIGPDRDIDPLYEDWERDLELLVKLVPTVFRTSIPMVTDFPRGVRKSILKGVDFYRGF